MCAASSSTFLGSLVTVDSATHSNDQDANMELPALPDRAATMTHRHSHGGVSQHPDQENHATIELADRHRREGSSVSGSSHQTLKAPSMPTTSCNTTAASSTNDLLTPVDPTTNKIHPADIITDVDLEDGTRKSLSTSGPPSPTEQGTPAGTLASSEVPQTITDPYKNRFRFLAICLLNFSNGLCDSAPGALIPYMEKQYSLGYALISLIFIAQALGFILAAPLIEPLRTHLHGRGPTLALSQSLLALSFIPLVATAPYPAIIVSFFFFGFCGAFNLAIGNVFCGGLRNGTTALGVMHGSYGIGGTVGPLIATGLVTVAGTVWSRYYFITLEFAVVNCVVAGWAFWGYEREAEERAAGGGGGGGQDGVVGERGRSSSLNAAATVQRLNLHGMFTAVSSRVVLLGALFIFAYQGAEVSISGWVITFLIKTRGGDISKVGYVTAGFWGGITLGRFLLSAPAHRIGEKKFVYAVILGAFGFQLIVWLVPNIVGDAVAVAIVGLLLGPVYPCAAAVFLRGMTKHEQVSGIGVISAFGSSGGAAAPFMTGFLAQEVGPWVLHPIAIVLYAVMSVCWWGQPSKPKKTE